MLKEYLKVTRQGNREALVSLKLPDNILTVLSCLGRILRYFSVPT